MFALIRRSGRDIRGLNNCQTGACAMRTQIEGGVLPLYAARVLPAYEEFKVEKEDFEKFMGEIVFGKRYLLERKSKKIKVEVKPAEEALNC